MLTILAWGAPFPDGLPLNARPL